jgi:HD-GYP domain-containing protein (c-di-GMP phosphodiesterase class II)
MSQKRKTGSGKERADAVSVAHATEDISPAAFPSTAALLTDCILPGLQGEPVVSPGRFRPDTCLLRGALAEVAAPLAIGPIESLSATATETILRERTNDFMAALRCKAEYLDEHSRRVGLLSAMLAADLGLSREQSAEFEWVGAFHDVGKLAISGEVLRKPGKLSHEEYEEIKAHPEYSETLVAPLARLLDCGWAAAAVRHHHERMDGGGYPDGLVGEEIPVEARILAVCDAYDAMAGCRPYQDSLAESTIRKNLADAAGSHLDREIVAIFLGHLTYYRERIYTSA